MLLRVQIVVLPGVAVNADGLPSCVWPVVMVTGTLLWWNAVSAVTYLKSIH